MEGLRTVVRETNPPRIRKYACGALVAIAREDPEAVAAVGDVSDIRALPDQVETCRDDLAALIE